MRDIANLVVCIRVLKTAHAFAALANCPTLGTAIHAVQVKADRLLEQKRSANKKLKRRSKTP